MNDQRDLQSQLIKLINLANKNGLYDAADFIRYNILGEKAICTNGVNWIKENK